MIVLTAFTGYSKDQIYSFVHSLNLSGFKGRKIVAYYSPSTLITNYLKDNGWEVYTFNSPKWYINVQRRADFADLIDSLGLEKEVICCVDMKDVYFAKNPAEISPDFFLGYDDNVTIEESTWNANTLKSRYPENYNQLKNFKPFNAGVMITSGEIMKNFFKDFINIIKEKNFTDYDYCPGADQSTFNYLAYGKYKKFITNNSNKFVIHMANLDKSEYNKIDGYHIYHQYERSEKNYNYVVNLNRNSYI